MPQMLNMDPLDTHGVADIIIIFLGDPAQLPAVSGIDICGTYLWHKFTILLLREIKRATDPTLSLKFVKVSVIIMFHKFCKQDYTNRIWTQ